MTNSTHTELLREALNDVLNGDADPKTARAGLDALDSLVEQLETAQRIIAGVRSKTALDVVAEKMASEDELRHIKAAMRRIEHLAIDSRAGVTTLEEIASIATLARTSSALAGAGTPSGVADGAQRQEPRVSGAEASSPGSES